jgi:hypothetical protein
MRYDLVTCNTCRFRKSDQPIRKLTNLNSIWGSPYAKVIAAKLHFTTHEVLCAQSKTNYTLNTSYVRGRHYMFSRCGGQLPVYIAILLCTFTLAMLQYKYMCKSFGIIHQTQNIMYLYSFHFCFHYCICLCSSNYPAINYILCSQ